MEASLAGFSRGGNIDGDIDGVDVDGGHERSSRPSRRTWRGDFEARLCDGVFDRDRRLLR